MGNRLCSKCDQLFPQQFLSGRLRNRPVAAGEIDPKTAAGIVAFGNTTTAVATAAAAVVLSDTIVQSLPANGTTAANGKGTSKGAAKTQLRQDTSHKKERETLVANIGQHLSQSDRYISDHKEPPKKLLDNINKFNTELAALDNKFAVDNSIKNIAGFAATFADLDTKVEDVAARIVKGVASLGQ